MRRYWVPQEMRTGDLVHLTGDILHHIRDVCRLGMGSKFEVLLGDQKAYLVEIVNEGKAFSHARILEERSILGLPKPTIHLIMSIPRFPIFEAVVEKAVELGVEGVHLVYSDFSFVRKQEDAIERKWSRWQRIIQSATQQSGRGELMQLHEPVRLDQKLDIFNRSQGLHGLFAYEGDGVLGAQDAIAQTVAAKPEQIWVFVGSEGGFSINEVGQFQKSGMQPLTLGAQVLRVETACVALVSIIKYGLNQMR